MGVLVLMTVFASCDECGHESQETRDGLTEEDARDQLREDGWKVELHDTLCPDCYIREDDEPDGGEPCPMAF